MNETSKQTEQTPEEKIATCTECYQCNVMHGSNVFLGGIQCPTCQGVEISRLSGVTLRLLLNGRIEEALLVLMSLETCTDTSFKEEGTTSISREEEECISSHINYGRMILENDDFNSHAKDFLKKFVFATR